MNTISTARARYELIKANPDGYTPQEGIAAIVDLDRAEGLY